MLELKPGEFYGQLVESDFSSFKAQIKVAENMPLPELAPVTQVTTYDLKQNFLRVQEDIEGLFNRQRPTQGGIVDPVKPAPITPMPVLPAQNNGQALQPGESLDF